MTNIERTESAVKTVLEQIGDISISKSHKRHYHIKAATLELLMTHNITPAVFKNKKREGGKDNVDRILNYLILDHDGNNDELMVLLIALRERDISYITWASPSRKTKEVDNLYKTRIIIPTIGLTKGMYAKQFLQLLIELGQEIDISTDETAQEITRFFYPPCMDGILEPKTQLADGKYVVLNPKPRNQDIEYAYGTVTVFRAKPYTAKKRFTQQMTQRIEEKQAYAYSEREDVYLPDDTAITHCGVPLEIGTSTFAEILYATPLDAKVRCDCPFEGDHGTSKKEDSAFISNGHVICTSHTHAHLIGRAESDDVLAKFVDITAEFENEGWL